MEIVVDVWFFKNFWWLLMQFLLGMTKDIPLFNWKPKKEDWEHYNCIHWDSSDLDTSIGCDFIEFCLLIDDTLQSNLELVMDDNMFVVQTNSVVIVARHTPWPFLMLFFSFAKSVEPDIGISLVQLLVSCFLFLVPCVCRFAHHTKLQPSYCLFTIYCTLKW